MCECQLLGKGERLRLEMGKGKQPFLRSTYTVSARSALLRTRTRNCLRQPRCISSRSCITGSPDPSHFALACRLRLSCERTQQATHRCTALGFNQGVRLWGLVVDTPGKKLNRRMEARGLLSRPSRPSQPHVRTHRVHPRELVCLRDRCLFGECCLSSEAYTRFSMLATSTS